MGTLVALTTDSCMVDQFEQWLHCASTISIEDMLRIDEMTIRSVWFALNDRRHGCRWPVTVVLN
jgi:hypothetical protein